MTSNTSRKSTAASASTEPTLDTEDLTQQGADALDIAEATPPADSAPAAAAASPADDVKPATADAPAVAPRDPRKVLVKLAHPLDKEKDLLLLGLPLTHEIDGETVAGYGVLEEVEVTKSGARTLISAGYAAYVDPENKASVAAVLSPSGPAA